MTKIIYLNGASSCGKSTLAKGLQNALSEPYLHIGIDKVIELMPEKINDWFGDSTPEGFSWKRSKDATGVDLYHIQMGPYAQKISKAFKAFTLLLVAQEFNLIIDDVAFGGVEVAEWKELLKGYDALFVGLFTPLEVLERREIARGDRRIGSARGQIETVHKNADYDLRLNTHDETMESNIQIIKKMILTQQ